MPIFLGRKVTLLVLLAEEMLMPLGCILKGRRNTTANLTSIKKLQLYLV